jgi:hypothetical protein
MIKRPIVQMGKNESNTDNWAYFFCTISGGQSLQK